MDQQQIVAVDIGGTHARFAIADLRAGRVVDLGPAVTLRTAEHASLGSAWAAFAAQAGQALPRAAGIAVACPISGDVLKLTNNPWVIRPARLPVELGLDRVTLVNDFGAVGHAVAQLEAAYFSHLAGPPDVWPDQGVISIVGPGTGLGVAQILRQTGGYQVVETEGGHLDFAPLDAIEDAILAKLRARYRRVSTERIASGPGLAHIYETLAQIDGRAVRIDDDKALWDAALAGRDTLAVAALERFCLSLGSIAGDLALAQGAKAVVIAGGIGPRIADFLPQSGFAGRFAAKGRFEAIMAALPVKLLIHPQPGLFGAAAAFARQWRGAETP